MGIGAVVTHPLQVVAQQAQRLAGQAVGNRVLQVSGGVGLDGVDHRIDAGGGGHGLGQPQGQVGVEQGNIRQQGRRDDHILLALAGGDHRYGGDFGAGAGGGGHQNQRQAAAVGALDTVDIGQRFFAAGQQCGQFGRIQRAAAAKADHAIGAALPGRLHRVEDHRFRRVGLHFAEHLQGNALFSEAFLHRGQQAGSQYP
ncbi:hypothetical protein D3C84_573620 [compost metagenome]